MKLIWLYCITLVWWLSVNVDLTRAQDPDYFYEDSLSKDEIEMIKKERQSKLEEAKRLSTTTSEPDPEWFAKTDAAENPMEEYMKKMMQDYIKKYQKEQMDKIRASSKKSDLNHPLLSIITLSVFFGSGIVIGISIVLIKGNHAKISINSSSSSSSSSPSNVNNKKTIDKKAYMAASQNDQLVV